MAAGACVRDAGLAAGVGRVQGWLAARHAWFQWGFRLLMLAVSVRLLWSCVPVYGWVLAILLGYSLAACASVGGYAVARLRLYGFAPLPPPPPPAPATPPHYVVQPCCILYAGRHVALQPLGSDVRMPLAHGDHVLVAFPQAEGSEAAGPAFRGSGAAAH